MKEISFEILGTPVAKGRAKIARRGNFASMYTPKKTVDAERSLLAQALQYKPETPWNGALGVKIEAIFARPKSHYRTGKNSDILRDDFPLFHTIKPDADNICKMCLDAMNEVFFKDDSQIVVTEVKKRYGDVPKIKITLYQVNIVSEYQDYFALKKRGDYD